MKAKESKKRKARKAEKAVRAELPKRKWKDVPGGLEYYIRKGTDTLSEQASKVLSAYYGKLPDDVENLIADLLHERRWIRNAATKWYRLERMREARKNKEK